MSTSPGKRFKELRELLSLSQNDVAEIPHVDVHRLYISKIERDAVQIKCNIATAFIQYAKNKGLSVSLDWLLMGAGEPPRRTHQPAQKLSIPTLHKLTQAQTLFESLHPEGMTILMRSDNLKPYIERGDIIFALPVKSALKTPQVMVIELKNSSEQIIGITQLSENTSEIVIRTPSNPTLSFVSQNNIKRIYQLRFIGKNIPSDNLIPKF